MMLGMSISWGYLLNDSPYDIPIVGSVPNGIPTPALPEFSDHKMFARLLFQALWYSVVFYGIHISLAKSMALKHRYSVRRVEK